MAAQVKEEVGDVTILINNAGVVTGKQLVDAPDHLIKRTMDVNTTAHFWVSMFVSQNSIRRTTRTYYTAMYNGTISYGIGGIWVLAKQYVETNRAALCNFKGAYVFL